MMILQQTRGALSSGDQLALDLPFAETKSLAARIGPTPTFTRGSGATYVGSDGLIHGVDTSTTSNTIGTGSKTFTLAATAGQDQLYRTGDAVDASNGSNSMVGTVTSYDASTQVLVCNITSVTGSGTFSSWRIGYRGPRFDHNPANPTICRGLLIEEGRTNNVTQSGSMNLWGGAGGSTRAVSTQDSPDGTKATIATTGSSSFGAIIARSLSNLTSTIGTQYTASCFVKKDNWRYVSVDYSPLRPSGANVPFFDLDTLTFNSNGSTTTGIITSYPNGWYRLAVSGAAISATSAVLDVMLTTSTGVSNAPVGGLVAYIWGAQLELGSFATSYIPTTTSALARSGDVCTISSTAFSNMWSRFAGTVVIRATDAGNNNSRWISTDVGQRTLDIIGKTNISFYEGAGNSTTNIATSITLPATVGLAYEVNNYRSAYNGILGGVDTNTGGTLPNPTFLDIGRLNTIQQLCGCISFIRYYKKSLSNAKLQALTA